MLKERRLKEKKKKKGGKRMNECLVNQLFNLEYFIK